MTVSRVHGEEMINCLFSQCRKSPSSKTAPSNCNSVESEDKALPAVGGGVGGGGARHRCCHNDCGQGMGWQPYLWGEDREVPQSAVIIKKGGPEICSG